jgi:RNA polymerase sigma-70 factor (ECF subfamily)
MPDAEDVFQQTSVALWENYDQFTPGTNFGAWATSVARHRVAQFIRCKQRDRHSYFPDDVIDELAACPFAPPDVQEARLKALGECRKRLPAADQRLIALCYGGAGSIRDAANQIGRPVQTVYCSLTRIRARLRECIERRLAREAKL